MLRIVAFTIFGFVSAAASAQTYFSFSGLQWGDSLEQVESRLQNAGLPLTSKAEKFKCRVVKTCNMTFGEGTRGTVSMTDGKLVAIHVFSENAPNTFADRLTRLRARYGEPIPPTSSRSGVRKFELIDEVTRWEAPNGENLELISNGGIYYKSSQNKVLDQGVKF